MSNLLDFEADLFTNNLQTETKQSLPRQTDFRSKGKNVDAEPAGLTLLEVLIAVFILGVVLTTVYGAYISNMKTIESARRNSQVNQVARIVLDRMSKDVESAIMDVPSAGSNLQFGFIGEDEEIDSKPADRLNFTSVTHLAMGAAGVHTDLCEIGYYLEPLAEDKGFTLYRRDDPTPDDDMTTGGSSVELAREIAGLNVTFENSQGETVDSWNTLQEGSNLKLPLLVRFELFILDQDGKVHLFTTAVHPALAKREEEKGKANP